MYDGPLLCGFNVAIKGLIFAKADVMRSVLFIIIIFYLPKKEAGYQKSRSSSYAGRPLYNDS